MVEEVQFKRRINGSTGSPSTANAPEGSLALNFPGAAGTTGTPELWAFDGVGYRRVNPVTSAGAGVTVLQFSSSIQHIGEAAQHYITTVGPLPTNTTIIASCGTPLVSYILVNAAQPTLDSSWAPISGAVTFATPAEAIAGAKANIAVDPVGMKAKFTDATLAVPSAVPTGDKGKIPLLDVNGKIPPGFIPLFSGEVGACDPTAPAPTASAGDLFFATNPGAADSSFTGIAGAAVLALDALLFDGALWYLIPAGQNVDGYLTVLGGQMAPDAQISWPVTGGTPGSIVLDGGDRANCIIKNFTLDNVVIDGGIY